MRVCTVHGPITLGECHECYDAMDKLCIKQQDEIARLRSELEAARKEVDRLKDIIGKKRLGQHMHGIDVCAYCAEGDIAKSERDAANALLREARKYLRDHGGDYQPELCNQIDAHLAGGPDAR